MTMDDVALMSIVDPAGSGSIFEKQHIPERTQVACWTRQEETNSLQPALKTSRWTNEYEEFSWNTRNVREYVKAEYMDARDGKNKQRMEELAEATESEPQRWDMEDIEEAIKCRKIQKANFSDEQLEYMLIHQTMAENELVGLSQEEKRLFMLAKVILEDPALGNAKSTTASITLQKALIMPKAFAPMTPTAKHIIRSMFHMFDCKICLTINLINRTTTNLDERTKTCSTREFTLETFPYVDSDGSHDETTIAYERFTKFKTTRTTDPHQTTSWNSQKMRCSKRSCEKTF